MLLRDFGKHVVSNKMRSGIFWGTTVAVLLVWGSSGVTAAADSEQAHRHFTRGLAAVEMSRSSADYALAIREMEKAKQSAPQWSEVYYNLGLIYEVTGQYDLAMDNLRRYLELAPEATDTAQVRETIHRLENLYEKNNVAGIWKADNPSTGVSCTPESHLVTDETNLFSRFLIDDLQVEFTSGPEGDRARILSGKFRYGRLLKDAPLISVRREGPNFSIDKAVMYTCAPDVDPGLCPWEVSLELVLAGENLLEGRIEAGGIGYWAEHDQRRTRKVNSCQCTGNILLRRRAR